MISWADIKRTRIQPQPLFCLIILLREGTWYAGVAPLSTSAACIAASSCFCNSSLVSTGAALLSTPAASMAPSSCCFCTSSLVSAGAAMLSTLMASIESFCCSVPGDAPREGLSATVPVCTASSCLSADTLWLPEFCDRWSATALISAESSAGAAWLADSSGECHATAGVLAGLPAGVMIDLSGELAGSCQKSSSASCQ